MPTTRPTTVVVDPSGCVVLVRRGYVPEAIALVTLARKDR